MDAFLWAIPALPLGGAAVNGLVALVRRWTPGDPGAAHEHGHPAAEAPAAPAPKPVAIAVAPVVAPTAATPGMPARIRLPGEKRRDEKPPAPTHAPSPAHGDAQLHDGHGATGGHGKPGLDFAGWLACATMLAAFGVSLAAFLQLSALPVGQHQLTVDLFPWIRAGLVDIHASFLFDPLSGLLALVVTGVGFLIHVYSLGYMAHDENRDRYFTYLNLFAGMMLILILGDSLPLLFVGWEGVGLCSYLLIGFWYTDLAKAQAGKKAFIVNRVGDFGFLLGMFVLFAANTGAAQAAGSTTLSFVTLHHVTFAPATITLAAILLFVGACGKSAQFPLYIWLPDAMAGPTPVSALIHAATMVTAGVYMIARMSFLFSLSQEASALIAIVGGFTAIFAATMGFVQNDVKKILAYSTVSQLGFMILAVGSGSYAAGIFHLMTHAFFKALLFLAAGSLIHAMEHALPEGADPNDIRTMGGLRKKMVWTFLTFTCGWAAICGIPFTSGFFSKDLILEGTLASPILPHGLAIALFVTGLAAAGCTAFYMTRLYILVFFGEPRMGAEAERKVAESGPSMVLPMAVLALLSLGAGVVWAPIFGRETLAEWLEPVLATFHSVAHESIEPAGVAMLATALATTMAFAGILAAWFLYVKRPDLPPRLAAFAHGTPYRMLWDKYYVDQIVEGAIVEPVRATSATLLWKGIDVTLVDGAVNGTGAAAVGIARALSAAQNGRVQSYAVGITFGAAAIAAYLLFRLHS
jgi:NADH-quinone oxidoreductase subunit L